MKSKLLAVVALIGMVVFSSQAAPVTFWFGGNVTGVNNPSNVMPFQVSVGMPFAGQVTYDANRVYFSNITSYAEGDIGFYYFTNTAGYSVIFQIAGHTLTNTTVLGRNSGLVGYYDQYNNSDSFWAQSGPGVSVDGSPFLSDPDFSGIYIYLSDPTKLAINSVVNLDTNPPVLADFGGSRDLTWGGYIDDGGPTQLFAVQGVITSITSTEQVLLNYQRLSPDTLQLSWSATFTGFTLQSCTNLAAANWQTVTNDIVDINVEHTVTLAPDSLAQFFRLQK